MDGRFDKGRSERFDNRFFRDFSRQFIGEKDEGFDGRRCFDTIRLEMFRLGLSRGIDRALFNDDMG
jgi:hypothetical protein